MKAFGLTIIAAVTALAAPTAALAQHRADFGERDDGRDVRLFSPQFTVELPRNAGTGYHWEWGNRRSRNVVLVSRSGATPPHPPGFVGFRQLDRFTFRATASEGELRIGLLPPGSNAPERVWRIGFHSAYQEHAPRDGYLAPPPPQR